MPPVSHQPLTHAERAARKQNAISTAADIYRDYGGNRIPVLVDRIAKKLGFRIRYQPMDEGLSGIAFMKDETGFIGVNSVHPPNRQRFTIAHELGHLVLHQTEVAHAVMVDKDFRGLMRDDLASQGIDHLEIEANAFAAELLMPREKIIDLYDDLPIDFESDFAASELAKKFKVSAAAINNRLVTLIR
ncbi:MAG: ImmA/IrrE family metallo-endopeptidase [Gammaproteobacteria bacterium]|nr:ImmA/IrrE family metallo-endopeptidase [Gammaproteobacteria bacterium]MCP5136374.1 ImmA/IrrE family metallo-endopeptidase [Gammaproteobacteria bacterium]